VAKESLAVGGGETIQGTGHCRLELIQRPGGRLTQMGFEFCEGQFNRVEVRTVGWQITKAHASVRKYLAYPLDLVRGQIVQDERVARMQARPEHLLEINREDLSIDRSVHQKRSINLFVAQGRNEGGTLPVTVGHRTQTTLAAGAAAMQPGQLGVQAGFIDKDQPADIPMALLTPPMRPRSFNVGSVLLGGARRFFYSSTPSGGGDATGP
jgi:hypothetical protein